jgi:hypothetical protein
LWLSQPKVLLERTRVADENMEDVHRITEERPVFYIFCLLFLRDCNEQHNEEHNF